LSADGSEPSYVGSTHWAAILDGVRNSVFVLFMANRVLQIKELKCDFAPGNSPSEEDLADSNRGEAPDDSIFSLISPPSFEIILQSLPPRPMVDRRLSVYFKAKYAINREFRWKSAPTTPADISSHHPHLPVPENGSVARRHRLLTSDCFIVRGILEGSIPRSGAVDCPAFLHIMHIRATESSDRIRSTLFARESVAKSKLLGSCCAMPCSRPVHKASALCCRSVVSLCAV
jgi:hypothetical protein